jgi:hypothetical protein
VVSLDHTGRPQATPRDIGVPDAQPLLSGLEGGTAETRNAVLDALTRLPLDPDCWLEVRDYAVWALETKSTPEHVEAIELAARIPVRSVRERLWALAEDGDPDERFRAAMALAEAGDERAVQPLISTLGDELRQADASRLLARLDVSDSLDTLRYRFAVIAHGPDGDEQRFWLALALARTGEDSELRRFLKDYQAGDAELRLMWGDPSLLLAELRRGPALPTPARERLRETVATVEGEASRLGSLLVEADERPDTGSASPRFTPPPLPAVTAADRARVHEAIAGARLDEAEDMTEWRAAVEHLAEMLAAAADRRLVWSLVVSELFHQAASRELHFGNAIAELAQELGDDYTPDLDGLLDAYRPLASAGQTAGVGAQIAWAAAGAGLDRLLSHLAPELASPDDRLAAARLVSQAAGYVSAGGPPIFGGAPTAPEWHPRVELIDDVTFANGGGGSQSPPGRQPTRGVTEPAGRTEPRWINVSITDAGQPEQRLERAFRAGAVHEIAVFIGPEQEGAMAAKGAESFDEALGSVGDLEQLLVMLIPPPAISPPQTGTIFLPRTGTSRPCTFAVHVPAGLDVFEAQIHVYHRNRMIQLALLCGPVVADGERAGRDARIELELAVIRPGTADLGSREQFDLAVARTGAQTTGVADEELVLFDNDRIAGVVPNLTDILERIATGEPARRGELEDSDVVDDLRALAFQGRELDEAIGKPLRDRLGAQPLDRVQVLVESASDFFPIELVYDFPTPSTNAGLCPGWKDALLTGQCESDHEAQGPRRLADTVCPLGFWALSKVIERQVVGAESWEKQGLRGVEFAIRAYPTTERTSLGPPRVALFAASSRVDEVKKGQIGGVLKTLERIADTATYAETWDGWVEDVGRNSPTLLVLLSHTKEMQNSAALEIGEDQPCLLSQLNADYIKGSSGDCPVVLLLGCETAVTDFGLQTFVSKFQDLGAALVVGTIASVLGQRAAPVARAIATEIAAASKRRRPIATGDLLLAIRRKLLAKGELTALCLTAFGDADWQVGGER